MSYSVGHSLHFDGNIVKSRKINNQNLLYRLFERQTHGSLRGSHFNNVRKFYTNVFPNCTVVNVEKPPCFLRKFSPDGKYFIAFSADQTSIEIYAYQGAAAAEDIFQNVKGDLTTVENDKVSVTIRGQIFDRFFKICHTTLVAKNGEHLNRECSLFTDNSNYVIVGSAMTLPEDSPPVFWDIYRNNESMTPNQKYSLEDYTLHLVDLETGRLCDTRKFRCDKIFLSHNQGLYLYKDTLAVLSVQQQTIHIFQVLSSGSFIDVRSIGQFCFEDDQLYYHFGSHFISSQNYRPYTDPSLNSLKHRLMTFLYKRAVNEGSPNELRKFYQYFDQFKSLRMWKMQLLDENHLLIKYASEDVVTLKVSDPNSQPSFFVVYNMLSTEIMAVYENTSEEMLQLFESYSDFFRNASLHPGPQFTCSASSNIYARQIQQRYKHTIIHAKFGGHTEAVRRLLAQLPISSQSYSSSPYLDLSLFSYDDKWVSMMERPKQCGDHPIRFYARDSGFLKFKIYAGVLGKTVPATVRRLVAFTFHPTEPFAISVQRTNSEYVVNFHIRHCYYS